MNGLKKVRIRQISDGRMRSDTPVNSPEKAVELMRKFINNCDRETVLVLTLDIRLQPINVTTVSVGALSASVVSAREVFKTAILSNAASIIMMHNHPSGDVTPSREDIEVTNRIAQAGKILDISLTDHIITSERGIYSFRENGMLSERKAAVAIAAERG